MHKRFRSHNRIMSFSFRLTQQVRQVVCVQFRLIDDDSAIRFAAITALQRISGETFGYRYYDDALQRQPAIRQWQQWLKDHPAH